MIGAVTRNYRAHKSLLVVMLAFMYVPIFVLFLASISQDPYVLFPLDLTADGYVEVAEGEYNDEIVNSLHIGIGSGLISMVVGSIAAWGVTQYEFRFRYAIAIVFVLPLIVPTLILGVSSAVFHHRLTGFSSSVNLAMLSQSIRGSSFAFLIMMSQLNQYPIELDRAAVVYGASFRQRLTEVTVPLLWGSLLGAFLVATIIGFNDLDITFFTIGASTSVPTLTFSQMRYGLSPSLFALSALSAAATLALVFSLSIIIKARGYGEGE